jgi:polysaccharide biosynthesis/export protein
VKRSIGRHALPVLLVAAMTQPAAARQDAPEPAAPAVEATTATDASSGIEEEWTRWTAGRYRLTPGDVLEISFPFVPELNQTVTVQPDGFITLKDIPDIRVQGRTVVQLREDVLAAYSEFVRDPKLTITLKEFERPYFVANGEVAKPGRYELRGATTLTQALAIAGGTKTGANMSKVVLYRRFGEDGLEAKQINVSKMLAKHDLSEDPLLRPGDTIIVPKGVLGKVLPVLPVIR